KALAILENNYSKSLVWIITQCHVALKKDRGAAISIGRIDLIAETVEYISVGNIETRIYNTERATHLYSVNGTVGAVIPIVNPVVVPYIRSSCIVSFTDGISQRFELDRSMLAKSPQEIAYHIINNFRRDYDDTTVVVIK
ncbi:anti-sigma-regulatory factor (Ser/Thr protein kinase and phosphatase), partial [Candidatus Magnetoovum chiemensis]